MRKLFYLFAAVLFLTTACQKEDASINPTNTDSEYAYHKSGGDFAETFTTPMIAGGGKYDEKCTGTEVGTITVTRTEEADGSCTYNVSYDITMAGYVMDVTHLYIGPEDGIPATGGKKKNPKIGHFEFNTSHNPGVTSYSYSKNLPCEDDNVISAHAGVVYYDDVPDFCEILPETVDVNLTYPGSAGLFDIEIVGGPFAGIYEGWCIDATHNAVYTPLTQYQVYCGYNALPTALTTGTDPQVDHPELLQIINWILNQDLVGEPSSCGGDFTAEDIQGVLWHFIDDNPDQGYGDECRVNEIVEMVEAAGEEATNFEPGNGGFMAVVLVPPGSAQVLVATMAFEAGEYGDETAWGYGYKNGYCDDGTHSEGPVANGTSFTDSGYYGGNAWGWYFYGRQPAN